MASVKLKFKTDKTLKDGTHPIVIQVIHNRRRKVFYLGYSAKKSQWDKDNNRIKSNHPEHKNIKSRIKNSMRHMNNIIADFESMHKPNLDTSLSMPHLLMEMLVFSRPGYIELLPAWPKDFADG